jgi:hypothetical protein
MFDSRQDQNAFVITAQVPPNSLPDWFLRLSRRGVKLTIHLYLVPRYRMNLAMPSLKDESVWRNA